MIGTNTAKESEISSPFPSWFAGKFSSLNVLFFDDGTLSFAIPSQSALLFRIHDFILLIHRCILYCNFIDWSKLPEIIDARMINKLDGWKNDVKELLKCRQRKTKSTPLIKASKSTLRVMDQRG